MHRNRTSNRDRCSICSYVCVIVIADLRYVCFACAFALDCSYFLFVLLETKRGTTAKTTKTTRPTRAQAGTRGTAGYGSKGLPKPTLRTRPWVAHQGRTPETEEKGTKGGRERGGGREDKGGVR